MKIYIKSTTEKLHSISDLQQLKQDVLNYTKHRFDDNTIEFEPFYVGDDIYYSIINLEYAINSQDANLLADKLAGLKRALYEYQKDGDYTYETTVFSKLVGIANQALSEINL